MARTRPTHCRKGHAFAPENTKIEKYGSRRCRTCVRDLNRRRRESGYYRDYRAKNIDKIRAYERDYQARNKERTRAKQKKWNDKNKDRTRQRHRNLRLLAYGLTRDDFAQMLAVQGGVCAICRRGQRGPVSAHARPLCVDHNHETGAVRALLCDDCNRGLGAFGDSADILRVAALYIEKHRAVTTAKAV